MVDVDYDKIRNMKPEERLGGASGDPLYDRVAGILVGFKYALEERGGWMDIITTRTARKEIKQLLKDYKAGNIDGELISDDLSD